MRRNLGRGAAATVILVLVGTWIYVFTVAGRADPANTIADESFPPAARAICVEVVANIEELPTPLQAESASERSVVVVEATDLLVDMVDELRAVAPPPDDPDDGWLHDWLDDYEFYLDARYEYAAALLEDPDARFLITVRDDRDRLTADIDQVALANSMVECGTPMDV